MNRNASHAAFVIYPENPARVFRPFADAKAKSFRGPDDEAAP
jgi:hypothetical protein